MQLAIASPDVDVDQIDLVLAAWSQAAPAVEADLTWPTSGGRDASGVALADASQLALRLEDGQLPIWEARTSR